MLNDTILDRFGAFVVIMVVITVIQRKEQDIRDRRKLFVAFQSEQGPSPQNHQVIDSDGFTSNLGLPVE